MIYGNYWDEDQIIVANVYEGDVIPQSVFNKCLTGAPAFLINIYTKSPKLLIEHMFVECVPGTEHQAQFLDIDTGKYQTGPCAKVLVYLGQTTDFGDMLLIGDDTWPLLWFKISKLPPAPDNPYDAYNRAMAIIGG